MTIPIEGVLEHFGIEYDPVRENNQQVKCPFHMDTHASASVNLGKGLFKCFGCDISGDGIALLMSQEGMEFDAAKRLAEELVGKAGAALPRVSDRRGSFLPSKPRTGRGGREWSSPWSRRRP